MTAAEKTPGLGIIYFLCALGAMSVLIIQLPRLIGEYNEEVFTTAVETGDIPLVKAMLDEDPTRLHHTGLPYPPLHLAASFDQAEMCQYLLDRGASVNEPLDEAAVEKLKVIKNSDFKRSALSEDPLDAAFRADAEKAMVVLLHHGASPNGKSSGDLVDSLSDWLLKQSFLMMAIEESWPSKVKILIEAGADPKLKNSEGKDALAYAKEIASKITDDDKPATKLRKQDAQTVIDYLTNLHS